MKGFVKDVEIILENIRKTNWLQAWLWQSRHGLNEKIHLTLWRRKDFRRQGKMKESHLGAVSILFKVSSDGGWCQVGNNRAKYTHGHLWDITNRLPIVCINHLVLTEYCSKMQNCCVSFCHFHLPFLKMGIVFIFFISHDDLNTQDTLWRCIGWLKYIHNKRCIGKVSTA